MVNGPGRQKSEQGRNSWQWAKYVCGYSLTYSFSTKGTLISASVQSNSDQTIENYLKYQIEKMAVFDFSLQAARHNTRQPIFFRGTDTGNGMMPG